MIKRLTTLIISMLFIIGLNASDYIESYNEISEGYNNSVHDANVIRQINGGTVLIPEFDSSCPNEIKGPFSYACKIVGQN